MQSRWLRISRKTFLDTPEPRSKNLMATCRKKKEGQRPGPLKAKGNGTVSVLAATFLLTMPSQGHTEGQDTYLLVVVRIQSQLYEAKGPRVEVANRTIARMTSERFFGGPQHGGLQLLAGSGAALPNMQCFCACDWAFSLNQIAGTCLS